MKYTVFLIDGKRKDYAKNIINQAPEDYVAVIKPKTRKEVQSEKFHAMCGDVSKQYKYQGRFLTKDQWKILFISAHSIATGLGSDIVEGLEGEFANLRESSSQMSVSRMSSVIEYVLCFGSEKGIIWSCPGDEEIMNRAHI